MSCPKIAKIVPARATISDSKKKAAECEEKAKHAAEPETAMSREEALLYRNWMAGDAISPLTW
jgi:hypothetical protein